MKTKHTPGPWIFQIDDCGPLAGRPGVVAQEEYDCSIVHGDGFKQQYWESARGKKEMMANALLIAAAPELLEACQHALPEWAEDDDGSTHDGQIAGEITWGDVRRMKRAIAKATGEA